MGNISKVIVWGVMVAFVGSTSVVASVSLSGGEFQKVSQNSSNKDKKAKKVKKPKKEKKPKSN